MNQRIVAITTTVLGVVVMAWSILVSMVIVSSARLTYLLPPPSGSTEAVERHAWNEPALLALALPGIAFLLAVAGIVLAARGHGTRGWVILLPLFGITIASAGLLAALAVPTPTF